MPRIGLSITKTVSFRGATQEFSNVYYFEMAALPSAGGADTIIDNMANKEKSFHSSLVTFTKGRVWSQEGSPGANQMISQKNLTGTGQRATPTQAWDRERAFLFRLRAGTDSRGNSVYLRKWYHSCGNMDSSAGVGTPQLEQTSPITSTDKALMVTAMQGIGDANGSAGVPKLCAKGGRQADVGANWTSHNWLEHHQLGDQWRG